MTGGALRRLAAGALLLASLVALPGQAGASSDTATFAISGPTKVDEAGGQATYTITMTGSPTTEVSVDVATADGTAVAESDYTALTAAQGHLEWAVGDTDPKKIDVLISNDTLDENAETFTVSLSNESTGTTVTTRTTSTTIVDDDAPPTVTIQNAADVTEGGTASFAVKLSSVSGREVRVGYRTADGIGLEGAKAGSDFTGTSGSEITIPRGLVDGVIEVRTLDDADQEPDEVFSVVLLSTETATVGTPDQATAKIIDNEAKPTLSIEGGQLAEGQAGTATLKFTVKLSAKSAGAVEVTATTTTGGTATAPGDYAPGTKRITFQPGDVQQTFEVTVKNDSVDEDDETVIVRLTDPSPAAAMPSPREAAGTIVDDDNSQVSVADTQKDEPSSGSATMTFTVTLKAASERPVNVSWATADGTATAGVDYTAGTGVLAFAPGQISQDINVTIAGDAINEENETLLVKLTGGPGVDLLDAEGQGTIVDKNAPPSLSISDTPARESEGATFTVTLAGTTLRTVTVGFRTSDGTAKAGSDYAARVGTLTFAPGEKSKTIVVTVNDDALAEGLEDFFVALGDPVNATITKGVGKASIEASDQALISQTPPLTPVVPKTPTTPKRVQLPRMILGPRTVLVRGNGIARMLVTCQRISPVTCAGSVTLERVAKPVFKLGTKKFSVRKGTKAYASIRLSARGLKLLRKQGTLRVRVLVFIPAGKKTYRPGIVTLTTPGKAKPAAPPPTQVYVETP